MYTFKCTFLHQYLCFYVFLLHLSRIHCPSNFLMDSWTATWQLPNLHNFANSTNSSSKLSIDVYIVLAWICTKLEHCRAMLHKTHVYCQLYYVYVQWIVHCTLQWIVHLAARVHWVKLQPSQLPSPFNCLLNNANHKCSLQITNTNNKYKNTHHITNHNLINHLYEWLLLLFMIWIGISITITMTFDFHQTIKRILSITFMNGGS